MWDGEGATDNPIAPVAPAYAPPRGRLVLLAAGLLGIAATLAILPFVVPPIGARAAAHSWASERLVWLLLLLGYALAIPFLIGAALGSVVRDDDGRLAGRSEMALYVLWVAALWSVSGVRPQVGVPMLVRLSEAGSHRVTELTMLLLNLYLFNAIGMHGGRFGAALRRRVRFHPPAPPAAAVPPDAGAQHEA
jgi:hypothetical protein